MKRMQNGFTLMEMIVAVGVFAMISIMVSQIVFSVTKSNTKVEILKEAKQSGDFALSVMGRMVQNAQFVDPSTVCTPLGSPTTPLTSLTITNQDGGVTTFSSGLDGTVERIASQSGAATQFITANTVTLQPGTLAFTCQSVNGKAARVTVGFTLKQSTGDPNVDSIASLPFSMTIQLRNR